jgi:hypothetical protein
MNINRACSKRVFPILALLAAMAATPLIATAQRDTSSAVNGKQGRTDSAGAAATGGAAGGGAAGQSKPSTPPPPDAAGKKQSATDSATRKDVPPYGFPSWPKSLFYAALLGMVGGLIADLLANAGTLTVPELKSRPFALGFVSDLLIGAVAAVIAVLLKRPEGSSAALILTALAGGVAAKAVLTNVGASMNTEAVRHQAITELDHLADKVKMRLAAPEQQMQLSEAPHLCAREVDDWATKARQRIMDSRWPAKPGSKSPEAAESNNT